MKTWIISDTHFNHDKIVEYCSRPTNHTEIILNNWRKLLKWDDLTIHLGDVIFGQDAKMEGMIRSVPGRKILLLGNHDKHTVDWYMARGFDFACKLLVYKGIAFSHYPLDNLPEGSNVNIHGHHHNNLTPMDYKNHRPFHRLFALENLNYKPVLLEEFMRKNTIDISV